MDRMSTSPTSMEAILCSTQMMITKISSNLSSLMKINLFKILISCSKNHINSKTELFIKVSGINYSTAKGTACRSGPMAPSMSVTGKTTWLTVSACSIMLTAMSTKENGLKTKRMATALTFTQMVLGMKATGERMRRTVRAKKSGLTAPFLKALTKKARNTVRATTFGVITHRSKETGRTTTSMDTEHTSGPMADSTKETGRITTCMAREFTPGPMAEATKANTTTIKSTDTACTSGLMAENIMVIGMKENRTEKANMSYLQVSREKAFGRMATESSGLLKKQKLLEMILYVISSNII